MTVETILAQAQEEEKENRRKPRSYNYFTFVWYPYERPDLMMTPEIYSLGFITKSPMHGQGSARDRPELLRIGQGKVHYHVDVKSDRKKTANAFLIDLCKAVNNDFTGIAVTSSQVGVGDIKSMLRYNLHLNNPLKEHFNISDYILSCDYAWAKEYSSAFEMEIQVMLQNIIISEMMTEFKQVINAFGKNNIIISEWLNHRKHMQLVYNLLNDNRKALAKYES